MLPAFGGLVWTLLAFVVALSIIVAVHEYGHYIVGRWSGIHAEVFSLGFGPVVYSRIDKRGIPYEKYIDAAYLERLGEAYMRYFHLYTASPLLIVNTAEIDPANNSRDFDDLFDTIRQTTSGRHYVNPVRA